MRIQIPCTRISARILAAEYGTDPIPLKKRHPLFYKIRPAAKGFALPLPHVPLDARFEVDCSPAMAKRLARHHLDAGTALYRSHMENMMEFAWARQLAGVPPLTSLKLFYEIYGILEEELDIMSAHKAWQRWKKKNGKRAIKHRNFYPVCVPTYCNGQPFEFPIPEKELQPVIDMAKNTLYHRRPDTPQYFYRQVSIWFHFKKGKIDMPTVAKKHKVALRTAYHAVTVIDGYLTYDEELAALLSTNPATTPMPTFAT